MRTAYHMVLFIGDPMMALLGFLMFCYPHAWATMNARISRKELCEFNTPQQLASTRRLGGLMLALAAFSCLSLLAMNALVPLK